MPFQCKVGDIGMGVCFNHPVPIPYVTTLITGANTTQANGPAGAIVTSLGSATCGCTTTAQTGSTTVMKEGLGCHRLGDTGTTGSGTYTMMTASGNIDIGG